ncbi:MAG: Rieske 2Fe-2S domain-containing protein [Planctomycetes bacterium]|nr:Rieske 2Fe-2S domain-containing protein [Planctomycetota bacterium]
MSDEIPLAPLPDKPATKYSTPQAPETPPRRGFFSGAASIAIGALIGVVPTAAGLATLFDPLRRKGSGAKLLRVASLDTLPTSGEPRAFPILADYVDAWNRLPNQPIGTVYLRRLPGTDKVEAFNATCPHAGCMVSFKPERNQFQCPCHTSAFEADGSRVMPCVSPRDLDGLKCEVRKEEGQPVVYVAFENFYSGMHEKKAKA